MRTDEGGRGGSTGAGAGVMTARATVVVDDEREGALATFRHELGDLWPHVSERCRLLEIDEMTALSERLEQHMRESPETVDRVLELANDLMALLAGWDHFGPDERRVLAGAMDYLTCVDDVVPDDQPGGLDDDDRVVHSAVRALLRPRRTRP